MRSKMSKNYFHLYDESDVFDLEGAEMADDDAAVAHGTAAVREIIADDVLRTGRIDLRHRVEITDEDGRPVRTVTFGDVLTIVS